MLRIIFVSMLMLTTSLHAANNPIELEPDSFLGFKDLGPWLKLPLSRHALDYGSGNGQSSFFLSKHGFNVQGVDIDSDVIKIAQTNYPNLNFQYIEKNNLPFVDDYFDLILSNFVLSAQKSKRDMMEYLREAGRVLTPTGILIALTYRSDLYKKNHSWGEFFVEDSEIQPGQSVHLKIHERTINAYYWQEKDYLDAIQQAKLNVCAVHYPKGSVRDGFHWKDERNESPIAVLLIARQCSAVTKSAQHLAYASLQQ